jgi:ATP-independent RNA helicase DbpA
MPLFTDLAISAPLLKALEELGYTEPTPIQTAAIPAIIEGKDIAGQAATGSGKTAAYSIPAIQRLDISRQEIQALVLVPTRELALQVQQEIKKLGKYTGSLKTAAFYGGHDFVEEEASLAHPPHILVATPGRLTDHISRRTLSLDAVQILILDEADKMLEMGFREELDEILMFLPKKRQSLLFSATLPDQVQALIQRTLQEPLMLRIEGGANPSSIAQEVWIAAQDQKVAALQYLLSQSNAGTAIVFCNTRAYTAEVADLLRKAGFPTGQLHGEMEQKDRDKAMVRFRNGSTPILVATDLAARGIDVAALDLVINLELPDKEAAFLHRSGRTGRAGMSGKVITLATPGEANQLKQWPGVQISAWHNYSGQEAAIRKSAAAPAAFVTLHINAGKKEKMSARDIVGAIISKAGLTNDQIGKIEIFDRFSYVAVPTSEGKLVAEKLSSSKIKGIKVKVAVAKE